MSLSIPSVTTFTCLVCDFPLPTGESPKSFTRLSRRPPVHGQHDHSSSLPGYSLSVHTKDVPWIFCSSNAPRCLSILDLLMCSSSSPHPPLLLTSELPLILLVSNSAPLSQEGLQHPTDSCGIHFQSILSLPFPHTPHRSLSHCAFALRSLTGSFAFPCP